MNHSLKTVYCIVGPTAVGKTNFAIQMAQNLKTEIISADARQCYQEMNIGVARPSLKELSLVPHYFIASHSIHQPIHVVDFEEYALNKLNNIFANCPVAIVVGGSGLYFQALTEGLDMMPVIDNSIKSEINNNYLEFGLEWLQNQIKLKDPIFWESVDKNNPRRLIRALELIYQTKDSFSKLQKGISKKRDFNIKWIGLNIDRNELYQQINHRVDTMLESGLLNEVKELIPYSHLRPLQTVGYSELFQYFNNECSLDEAINKIKQHSRNYAKRQITWFSKNKNIQWKNPNNC